MIEYTNISVGRGTNTPFELLGAPWINERDLAYAVNAAKPAGVKVLPIKFTPTDSKFKGQECHGLSIMITDLKAFKPFEFGLTIMHALHQVVSAYVGDATTAEAAGEQAGLSADRGW